MASQKEDNNTSFGFHSIQIRGSKESPINKRHCQ